MSARVVAVAFGVEEVPELLTAARQYGHVTALTGPETDAGTLGKFGATVAFVVREGLRDPRAAGHAIRKVCEDVRPELVLGLSTKNSREAFARASHSLGAPMVTDCLELTFEGGVVRASRLVLGGGYVATLEASGSPVFATLMSGRVEPSESSSQVEPKVIELKAEGPTNGVVKEVRQVERSAVDLSKAEVVVSVGRGFKRKEDLKLAEELAKALGAEIGCSRPIAGDLKWMPEDRHIGLSGKWVSPKLYVAVGISGQMQHIVGIRRSRVIVAVNSDPNAPIHKEADYSVIADLYQFLPVLTEKLKEVKR
ncbi:MAG: electron transfer flavoprotein subunit alpha/FixB family protein [Aigarchaeota archaeon]|nr:electron transfer flavoprotein subunit alpha/FixB family protein [Aigarchaeota archaeon]MCS7118310.1 electron transfer flavoprotein subunit alpha/FixB family protein [Candidatus Calditenuaceae archaeon]MDW8042059.1 electron transfer flavoprotein subunit alpha/FixB family protein [Nitrososphaerota archaeon]